jgi:O-antigen ligase
MLFKKKKIYDYFVILFPLAILLGPAIINIFLVLISIFFLSHLKNNYKIFSNNWVLLFFFFWFYLILISFFSENFLSSFQSSISQIRFFLFALFIAFFFNLKKNINLYISIIHIILLFVCIDVNLQFLSGYDIFGYPSEGYSKSYPAFEHWKNDNIKVGRLSGPFGSELIPGSFIAKLSCPIIFYNLSRLNSVSKAKKFTIILFLFLLFEAVLITGERLSLIIISCCFLASFFLYFKLKKIVTILLTFSLLFFLLYINLDKKNFIKQRISDGAHIFQNITESSYGRIYNSALNMWSDNKIFGVGLKNYRVKCGELIDPNPNSLHAYCSPTHPHNVLLEFLVETGLVGLFLFLIFYFFLLNYIIKNFKVLNVNAYQGILYGAIFHTLFAIIPFLPSGSFFSTFNASLYWFNIGVALSYIKSSKK